jgi:Domain of unknown function (DUF4142)
MFASDSGGNQGASGGSPTKEDDMKMAPRATTAALIALAIGIPTATAAATGSSPAPSPTPAGPFEKHFVKAASAGNVFEIRAGQIAQRAGSVPTCKIGMMLVADHTAAQAKLTAVGAAIGAPLKLSVTPIQGWLLRRLAHEGSDSGSTSAAGGMSGAAATGSGASTMGTSTGDCGESQSSGNSGQWHQRHCDKRHGNATKSGDTAAAHHGSKWWKRHHCGKDHRHDGSSSSDATAGGSSGTTGSGSTGATGPSSFDWTFLTLMAAAHRHDIAEYSEAAELTENAAVRQYACEQLPILIKHLASIQAAMTTVGVTDDSAAASAAAGDDSASDPTPTAAPAVCAA